MPRRKQQAPRRAAGTSRSLCSSSSPLPALPPAAARLVAAPLTGCVRPPRGPGAPGRPLRSALFRLAPTSGTRRPELSSALWLRRGMGRSPLPCLSVGGRRGHLSSLGHLPCPPVAGRRQTARCLQSERERVSERSPSATLPVIRSSLPVLGPNRAQRWEPERAGSGYCQMTVKSVLAAGVPFTPLVFPYPHPPSAASPTLLSSPRT